MKKAFSLLLSLLMITSIITSMIVNVSAATSDDYFSFWLTNNETAYCLYNCSKKAKGEVVVPESYKGLPVEAIGFMAFSGTDDDYVSKVTSIVLPDTIKEIEMHAFQDCVYLEKINLPESIESIGFAAFMGCKNLNNITLPSKITKISFNTFDGCSSLSTIVIPKNVSYVGDNAFYDCTSLKSVTLPKNITDIGYYCFYNCPNLTSVFIPESVDFIGDDAFGFYSNSEKSVKTKGFTIYGVKGSAAETYANENGFKFINHKTHTSSDWITDTKATVNKSGSKHKECTKCGTILKTETIPQLKCSEPAVETIKNTKQGVKITWDKVKGADKYRIYRKTSKTDWTYIGTTSETYYTDGTAKSGTKYYYTVKARNEAGNSSRSNSLSIYCLASPTLKAPSSKKSGVKLTWSEVAAAEGYIVYRKTSGGSYSKIADVKGSTNVTYTNKSAKNGKKYTYKVKAYKGNNYSAYSNTKTITYKY